MQICWNSQREGQGQHEDDAVVVVHYGYEDLLDEERRW